MQTAVGVLLLITFFAFIYYAAKGGNLLLGLFSMAVIWSALGVIGGVLDWETINKTIFQAGPEGFGPTAASFWKPASPGPSSVRPLSWAATSPPSPASCSAWWSPASSPPPTAPGPW